MSDWRKFDPDFWRGLIRDAVLLIGLGGLAWLLCKMGGVL